MTTSLLDHDGKGFLVKVPYGNAKRLKDAVQADWKRPQWRLPDLNLYANSVLELYPDMEVTERAYDRLLAPTSRPKIVPWPFIPDGLESVYEVLYPFQKEAVARLVDPAQKPNQQLVLSPGLGKTIVAMLAARMLKLESVLVVCIKDLMLQWQDEEYKWFGERTFVRLHQEPPDGPGWYIANYDTVVGRLHDAFLDQHWDLVIIDESVLIKNRKTRRYAQLLDLRTCVHEWITSGRKADAVDRVWELSGSPVAKYPDDLWTQLHLLYPEDFRSYWRLAKRYCHVATTAYSKALITDVNHDRDPKEDLVDIQFVRNQKDVLSELPEEILIDVPLELLPAQRRAYREMNSGFVTELESGVKVSAAIVLSKLIRLQQITSNLVNIGGDDVSAKTDALLDLIEAGAVEFPCLVWTNWVPTGRAIAARLKKYDLRSRFIHGATSKTEQRYNEKAFTDYKADRVDVLTLALTVGRFGHNLQNTRTVVWHDKLWETDAMVQARSRVLRIGLDHRPVVYTFRCPGTTDEMIEANIAGKLPSIAKVSNSDLASMLRSLTGGV